MSELTGNTRVTQAENREHDYNLLAKRVTDAPSKYEERFDWTSGDMDYRGYADSGSETDALVWFIEHWTWVGGNPTHKQIYINGAWDSRGDYF
jgi:hypothetical protein